MAVTTTFPFDDSNNYTFDNTKLNVTGGSGTLKLANETHAFSQDFASSAGFTFDSAKTEFVGGQIQQKDATPANSTAHADYSVNKDLNWGDGALTGVLVGSTSVSGGNLVIPTGSNNYAEYNAASNFPSGNTGTVRFRVKPSYSGSPGINQHLFVASSGQNNINNMVRLFHTGTSIRWDVYDSAGVAIKTVQTGNTWNPTAGVTYEIELNYDTTLGEYRLFIDGVNINGLQTSAAGSRNITSGIIRLGANYLSSASSVIAMDIEEFITFNTVQHTANYTPGVINQPTRYESDTITMPASVHGGLGFIQQITGLTTTELNSPRYSITSNGDPYKYWNGVAWAASDGTYAQASSVSDINTNLPTFVVSGSALTVTIKIHTNNGGSQMSVDQLNLTHIENSLYPIDDPTMTIVQSIELDQITAFTSSVTEPGTDQINFIMTIDGVDQYHNGSAWVTSDSSLAQSNTQAEITALLPITQFSKVVFRPKILFHSVDGTTTPTIENLILIYGFFNAQNDVINKNNIYGHNFDSHGDPDIRPFTIILDRDFVEYKLETIIRKSELLVIPDSDGFWQCSLVETENMEGDVYYEFNIPGRKKILKKIPNVASTAFVDLP